MQPSNRIVSAVFRCALVGVFLFLWSTNSRADHPCASNKCDWHINGEPLGCFSACSELYQGEWTFHCSCDGGSCEFYPRMPG